MARISPYIDRQTIKFSVSSANMLLHQIAGVFVAKCRWEATLGDGRDAANVISASK